MLVALVPPIWPGWLCGAHDSQYQVVANVTFVSPGFEAFQPCRTNTCSFGDNLDAEVCLVPQLAEIGAGGWAPASVLLILLFVDANHAGYFTWWSGDSVRFGPRTLS